MFIIGKPNSHKTFYGDKKYFNFYQYPILFLLNNKKSKIWEKTREFFGIKLENRIVKITPSALHYKLDNKYEQACFYSGNIFEWAMKTNFENLQRFLRFFHWWDIRIANKLIPALNLGFDTYSFYSSTADGYVHNQAYDLWATVRSATTGTAVSSTGTSSNKAMMAQNDGLGSCYIRRSFTKHDTSSLAGSTEISGIISLHGYSTGDNGVSVLKGTQADTLSTADFDSYGNSGVEYTHTTSWSTSAYNDMTLDAQGNLDINTGGDTKYCFMEYNHDYLNVDPLSSQYHNGCYYADYGTSRAPKLTVTYTPPAGGTGGGDGILMFFYN